jgi:hypothetical protein
MTRSARSRLCAGWLICRESSSGQLSVSIGLGFELSSCSMSRSNGAQQRCGAEGGRRCARCRRPCRRAACRPTSAALAWRRLAQAPCSLTELSYWSSARAGRRSAHWRDGLVVAGAVDCGTPVQAASGPAPTRRAARRAKRRSASARIFSARSGSGHRLSPRCKTAKQQRERRNLPALACADRRYSPN